VVKSGQASLLNTERLLFAWFCSRILAIMQGIRRFVSLPAGMFIAVGLLLVLIGIIGLVNQFVLSGNIFPGVMTPLVLFAGGGVLLACSVPHYLVGRLSGTRMSTRLAFLTLVLLLAGIGFYLATGFAWENVLDSKTNATGSTIVARMIRSELCGFLAVCTFVLNAILTLRKRLTATEASA
jgi:hypothetical protein